ncbi:uncharacterized protein LOC143362059 [Halictus rubicundus]|uniref:uncharacterized protein LOC143362059 n=1 Tax=Halictus rubicundus TaxID=77578 RepID=UPI0040369591
MKGKDSRQQNKENCLEQPTVVRAVTKLNDNRLVPSKMNTTFCNEVFPRQSSHVSQPCERQMFVETSQEALYQVKKKLESLHNVLRTYDVQNSGTKGAEKPQDSENIMNNAPNKKTVSIKTESNNWNDKKKNRVSFDTVSRKHFDDIHRTVYISSEQYDSDETGRSSDVSVRSYSQVLSTYYSNNVNDLYCSLPKQTENQMHSLNNQRSYTIDTRGYSSIRYDKIPERICYTISSDFFDNENSTRGTAVTSNFTLPDLYIENTQTRSFDCLDRQTVPMDTDEDLLITSPTSSHTEISKGSESDDKSTAVLLQEALQIKRALLTRVELEKICYVDEKRENTERECMSEYSKCSYVNNNLQSKLLDIISEEQSISSSTDRSSRTYMFLNIKQGKQLAHSSTFSNNVRNFMHENQITDQTVNKESIESNRNLASASEYFSFSNVMQENNEANLNQASMSEYKSFHETKSTKSSEMESDNLHAKHQSYASGLSDEKHENMKSTSCSRNVNNEEKPETNFIRITNVNELANRDDSSTEIFSQNLNESLIDEPNSNLNKNEGCNFLDSDIADQRTNVVFTKDVGNLVSTKLNMSQNQKFSEENENLMRRPNLSLKRHPGACSLIERTLVTENVDTMEVHTVINVTDTMYELSASESKENSIEVNLQNSMSVNHSNDCNIPEPLSTTALTNKSMDEKELNLNWSTLKDNYVDENNVQTASTNTITLQQYDYMEAESRKKETCNKTTTVVEYGSSQGHYDGDSKFKNKKDNSVVRNSFANLDNKEINNQADLYKSYSNLISPQSSMYFTDEASSSGIKLNNTNSKNIETDVRSTSEIEKASKEQRYHEENLKDTEKADLLFISMSNNTTNKIETKSYVKITNNEISVDKTNKENVPSENDISRNINIQTVNKTEETVKEEETSKNEISISYDNMDNESLVPKTSIKLNGEEQSNSSGNKTNIINVDQTTALSDVSPHQVSPRNANENLTLKKVNTTMQSRSQENYTPKSEVLKKSAVSQNPKNLKSNSTNAAHARTEHRSSPIQLKTRDLSAEPKRNTDHTFKLDKKRSQSQISFRSNASSSNANSVNCTQSLDTRLKLKNQAKPLTPVPKTSSRSCIPILKSRLEGARKTENESRHRSPVRGPLTMAMFWGDNLSSKSHYATEESLKLEGTSEINDQCVKEGRRCVKNANDTASSRVPESAIENTDSKIAAQEQMVIYVNIFTKYDHNATKIVDPNKFLEYIKDRETNTRKGTADIESNTKDEDLAADTVEKKQSAMHKIVTIVSSVINGNELGQNRSVDLTASKANSESLTNSLSNAKLKNLCFLSVEQREIDVTAKPSVTDTSTSITDLENVSRTSESVLNKFQICGTPKELSNDEYVALLEILYQEPNLAHLQELQNVCKRLVSER